MSRIKALILDMDGTVISLGKNYSYIPVFGRMFNQLLEELTGRNRGLSFSQIYSVLKITHSKSVEILKSWGVSRHDEFWQMVAERDYLIRKELLGREITAYPDAEMLLRKLKSEEGNIRIGLLTDAPEKIARAQLESAELLKHFDDIMAFNYNSEHSKPSGWGIRKMLTGWGIQKKDAWIFGDAEQDIEAGRDAGIWTAQLMRDSHPILRTIDPDVEGRDLLDLWRKANEMQVRE